MGKYRQHADAGFITTSIDYCLWRAVILFFLSGLHRLLTGRCPIKVAFVLEFSLLLLQLEKTVRVALRDHYLYYTHGPLQWDWEPAWRSACKTHMLLKSPLRACYRYKSFLQDHCPPAKIFNTKRPGSDTLQASKENRSCTNVISRFGLYVLLTH